MKVPIFSIIKGYFLDKFKHSIARTIFLVFLCFLIFLLLGSLFWKAEFCMVKYGDQPNLFPQNIGMYALYLGIIIIFNFLTFKLSKFLDRFKKIYVIPIFLILITAIQLLIIFSFKIDLTADWKVAQQDGIKILNNDLSPFQVRGYLHTYPNNIGITLYSMLFSFFFSGNLIIQRILNLFFTNIITLSIYFFYISLYKENSKNYHLLLILLFFLPPFFLSNLSYNDTISTMFFLLSIISAVKFYNEGRSRNLILSALALGVGNFLRPLGAVFLLAICLFFFLRSTGMKWILLYTFISALLFVLPTLIISSYLMNKGSISEPIGKNSAPLIKWVNIGINKERYGYWDKGESYAIYLLKANSNKSLSKEYYQEELQNKFEEMGAKGLLEMYVKKYIWLWTEGTYQSVYAGMSSSSPGGYIEETEISRFFENNIENRTPIKNYMYLNNIMMYIAICLNLIICFRGSKIKDLKVELLFVLIILGFIGFYSFWEIKPRYIFSIYPYLILLFYRSVKMFLK